MTILKIDHVGIAVRKLGERLPFWSEALGMEVADVETVDSEGVKIAFLPAGRSRIELLEPTGDDSPVARSIAKRGEGIHHLTLAVRDLDAVLARLRERGVELVGEAPRTGAGGSSIAFVHPRATGGVLVELVESAREGDDPRPTDIRPGSPTLVYLRDPQEKMWGVLRRLDASGVVLEGVDLGSFDDWVSQVERDEESVIGPSVLFVPMGRVEKLLLDRSSGDLPSLSERFLRRTGRTIGEVLGGD
jgi:methylmalonyl-CoA/ethylmalonyl-CoA epimerase